MGAYARVCLEGLTRRSRAPQPEVRRSFRVGKLSRLESGCETTFDDGEPNTSPSRASGKLAAAQDLDTQLNSPEKLATESNPQP